MARSYEEARALELIAEARRARLLLLRALLTLFTAAGNVLLWLLRSALFPFSRFTREVRSVLVYTVGTLGDSVLMLPAVAAVKRRFPGASLTVLTNCDGFSDYPAREIFGALPFVDRFIAVGDHPIVREGRRIRLKFPELAAVRCDLFVNLSPFGNRGWFGAIVRELILARRLGARRVVGFVMSTYNRKGVFNRVQHRFVKNEARRARDVLRGLGVAPVNGEDLLRRDPEAAERVSSLLSRHRKPSQRVVVLTPGAKLRASQWPAERFGRIAEWLAATYDACVILNGTASEKEVCAKVLAASNGAAVDLAGALGIQDLIELLRISAGCITNNTGPMTLAAALGIPMVVIASTRFSPAFYIPVSDKMAWLFAWNDSSYSYDDRACPSSDLLSVDVPDVQRAFETVSGLTRSSWREA